MVAQCVVVADLATIRNTQLDGWRAFAVLGVMGQHWLPAAWHGLFPLEIGLFFFLTLTGFLITRIALRNRQAGEASRRKWRTNAYFNFLKRRMFRILLPFYVALIFALALGAEDVRQHLFAYFGHWVNFHMAGMENWPSATAHYWSLAIQVQFYLVWPLVIFWVPQRFLTVTLLITVAVAPFSRMILWKFFPEMHHSEAFTLTALDYFGCGALLAWALERGMRVGDTRLKWAAAFAFLGYVLLYVQYRYGQPVTGFCYLQQTLLSVAFAGLISATLAGFGGRLGKMLDAAPVQHLGRLSYGLYLFHSPAPLLLGHILPFLWAPFFDGPWQMIRLLAFGLTSWGLAYLSWRYFETGLQFSSKRAYVDLPSR